MRVRSYLAVPIALTWLAITPSSRAQDCPNAKDPCIVGITGDWTQVSLPRGEQPTPKIEFGVPIAPGSCVAADSGSLVVMFSGKPISFACDAKDAYCPQSTYSCVRQITAKGSWAGPLFAAIHTAFSQPDRYYVAAARGLEPHLADSVIRRQGDLVDFAPPFRDMNPGVYWLRLEPLSGGTSTGTIQFNWPEKREGSAIVPGVKSGLYRLARLTSDGDQAEPGAWVLVDGPDRFFQDDAAFQSARDEIGKWPPDVDPRLPGAVLRAYLQSLSENNAGKR
jgi:hypothetical protein